MHFDTNNVKCAANVFNALLRYEIGDSEYAKLRCTDPATLTPHDMCDANVLVLNAIQHIADCDESDALRIASQDMPQGGIVGDWIQEEAESMRDLTYLARHI